MSSPKGWSAPVRGFGVCHTRVAVSRCVVSSPPVNPLRACAIGLCRQRSIRARWRPVGFLVLATSIFLAFCGEQARAQFPIRQVPQNWGPHAPVFPAASSVAPRYGQILSGVPSHQVATTSEPQQQPHPAIARIIVAEKDGISYGSGTLVDVRDQFGLVVTNWHVVRDAVGPVTVMFPGGFASPGNVVKTDKDWDLAAISIYRPTAEPLQISPVAPQLGEPLAIAGYGSGTYKVASGWVRAYNSPSPDLPQEFIELSAEARQGDSGGPIINQRGEVCGVLFGSAPGYTCGAYGGRLRDFLTSVIPGGLPGADATTLAAIGMQPERAASTLATGPQVTALHHSVGPDPYGASGTTAEDQSTLTPAAAQPADGLLDPPSKEHVASRFEVPGSDDPVDPRAAVESRPGGSLATDPADSLADERFASLPATPIHSTLPPRDAAASSAGVDLNQAAPGQVLAAVWRMIGGTTALDQTKTVLAIVGVLSLLGFFWRMNSKPEPEVEPD